MAMLRVRYSELQETLVQVFRRAGLPQDKAVECAGTIAESTFDGVLSHGINFVSGLLEKIDRGEIDVTAEPVLLAAFGAVERWSGRNGLGIWNARRATARAMELAGRHGVGCVALRETNHWSRAGAYGWQAVRGGLALICWTNTMALIPPWGASSPAVGNNPLVIAIPHPETPVVLDMAMSQFSMGRLKIHQESGEPLPVPGGYDPAGELTRDAAAILESGRVLPMGFWKGSGLALVLDLLAALLSGGHSTADFQPDQEGEVSQVFIAFRLGLDSATDAAGDPVRKALKAFHASPPLTADAEVLYPGERVLRARERNRREGMLIDAQRWEYLLERARAPEASP